MQMLREILVIANLIMLLGFFIMTCRDPENLWKKLGFVVFIWGWCATSFTIIYGIKLIINN